MAKKYNVLFFKISKTLWDVLFYQAASHHPCSDSFSMTACPVMFHFLLVVTKSNEFSHNQ